MRERRSKPATGITQAILPVPEHLKTDLLKTLLGGGEVDTALVFTRTKHGADKVVRKLGRSGISAAAIHGNKSQNARERALRQFGYDE